ncbi:MAG: hypothetical protein DRG71_06850 [Deltaproteobacteria bacterium]|nr:MAG: hypothetical protein DRG71_06850 [Deltaproteobacteria bacterium]
MNPSNHIAKLHEYSGNVHVHSHYSDGAASPAQIAAIAQRKGLDFVILNDHEYMAKELHLEVEGFYGKLLLLVGLEIGGRYHHYLAFGLKEMVKGSGLSPQQVIDQVNAQGGFGFLAHPFEKGMPFHEKSIAYTWNDLSVRGYTGICIWNFTSRWKERVKSPLHGLLCIALKKYMLKGPSKETLAFWDAKCQERKVVAIGGSDAHGSIFRWGPISLVPISYDYALTSITIHVLLPEALSSDFQVAKDQIYGAIKKGHLFIGHDAIAASKGFRLAFSGESGTCALMGEELRFEPGSLTVELPLRGLIRIIRNGREYSKGEANQFEAKVQKAGVYRVEVYKKTPIFGWRPWIFSNPIFLI